MEDFHSHLPPKNSIPLEVLKNLERTTLDQFKTPSERMLISRTANEWLEEAKKTPIPRMLFSEFWFEGEICVLFADTNAGKSILAIQIGDSIATGMPLDGFKMEAAAQPVLYFDFEMNIKQFECRYSNEYADHFRFSDNLFRIQLDPKMPLIDGQEFEDFLREAITAKVHEHNARILIIDNITYLSSESEKSKEASGLMKHLKKVKEEMGLSILALGHTPKRDPSRIITSNDCQGSKMLGNFCDSSFAIGKSNLGVDIRYIKQVKQRNSAEVFGEDNVCAFRIAKPANFLMFQYMGSCNERDHLRHKSDEEVRQVEESILKFHNEGLSLRKIAEQTGVSHMKVSRLLKECNKV